MLASGRTGPWRIRARKPATGERTVVTASERTSATTARVDAAAGNVVPRGVTAALATPIDSSGGLDVAALDRLVERVLAGGAVGISPLGSTGEGPRLSRGVRLQLVTELRRLVGDRVPVLAGVPLTALADAPDELRAVADSGAAAALVAPPSYYPADDDSLLRMYSDLADDSPIPLVLYNIPVFTKVRISPAVVRQLATHPRIAAIKDSSRDMEYFVEVRYATAGEDFRLVTGSDSILLPSLAAGADGLIAASVNLVPELVVGVWNAYAAGDTAIAAELQQELFGIIQACRRGIGSAGWKAALALAGVCSARPVGPDGGLDEETTAALAADLRRLRPSLLAASDAA